MNRDIITADIDWDETTIEPLLDLKVEIKDDDFDELDGVYIEDIKLYNQNTFVNPTKEDGGISFFIESDSTKSFHKINNKINSLFVKDETPSTEEGHYKESEGDYIAVESGETPTETYSFSNSTYYYYDENTSNYILVDYTNRKAQYFYILKPKAYEIKNLQNVATFAQNFDISNDLIIISVKIHPNPSDTCQSDYILKAIYNKRLLLLEAMAGVREIADTCTIPRRFIDFILRQKAIDLAEDNKDVDLLCKYFRMFSNSIGSNNIEFAPCGCLRH